MRSASHCYTYYIKFDTEDDPNEGDSRSIKTKLKSLNVDLRKGDLISVKSEHSYRNDEIYL